MAFDAYLSSVELRGDLLGAVRFALVDDVFGPMNVLVWVVLPLHPVDAARLGALHH